MSDPEQTIAYLQARVAVLEKRLAERSAALRAVARDACDEDLINLSRTAMGLPPLPRAGFGLRGWKETTTLALSEVDATMRELWRSVTPPSFGDGE
ncbi:MAG TPA: hypothetical protein VFF17_13900 [Thermoanaerobaculia bacterium]|nr:hypothetical protein [Thermoanaerobaculia bacterium]